MRRLLLLLVLAVAPALTSLAQESDEAIAAYIHENLYRMGVNTNPYEYLPVAETPVPKGYKPFYISHYGRHGSRSNFNKGGSYEATLDKYRLAHEAGLLTADGERAFADIADIIALHDGMNGRLTPRGVREHRAIAERMYTKYRKTVFRHARSVRAVSSISPRCIVSMTAFTGELLSLDPKLQLSWDTGERFMEYCSSEDPKDLKKEALEFERAFSAAHSYDTLSFMSRIFTDPEAGRKVVGSGKKMLKGTLSLAEIAGSFDKDTFLLGLFNEADLVYRSQFITMDLYLRQCNSREFGDRRMAVPELENLVDDIIAKGDEAVAGGDVAADLRFGHDWQLLAISARLGVKGVAERLTAKECVNWPGWLYTPFACNLQIVFYKNKSGDVLVKFYINERETSLLTLPGGPYYRWEDVKYAIRNIKVQ